MIGSTWVLKRMPGIGSTAGLLLCAAALALSAAAITTSVEIRQYQLAVFLVLVAFRSFLQIWRAEQTAGRHYVIFAVSSTLAVACHYSVILFWVPAW